MAGVLLVVSVRFPTDSSNLGGPRKDYTALAETLHATVLDYGSVQRSWLGRVVSRIVGLPIAQAVLAFLQSDRYDAILTDGAPICIPLCLLLKLRRSSVAHVTIGHRLSTPKKRAFFRWLRAHDRIDRIAVH